MGGFSGAARRQGLLYRVSRTDAEYSRRFLADGLGAAEQSRADDDSFVREWNCKLIRVIYSVCK